MLVAKFLQEVKEEPSALTRRMNQLVEPHENREKVGAKLSNYQQRMKYFFDKKVKVRPLQIEDLVLRWDVK